MELFRNSWRVRNLLVMVLTLNKSLKLAESIVSLPPHKAVQTQDQLRSISKVYTPLLMCHRQWQRSPLSIATTCHAKRSSPRTAGEENKSNPNILNSFRRNARRIELFAAHHYSLNRLKVPNPTLTKIWSKT